MQTTFNNKANTTLYLRDERETYHRATEEEVLNAALNAINARLAPGTPIETPDQAHDFIKLRLAPYPHEVFGVLWLDSRHNVIAFEDCFAAHFPEPPSSQEKSSNPLSTTTPPPASCVITTPQAYANPARPTKPSQKKSMTPSH